MFITTAFGAISTNFVVRTDLQNFGSICGFLRKSFWRHDMENTQPHLNYVTGYTGPFLFLFERTHNYYVDNQGLVPWWLRRLGRSKVCSASLVKVLSDVKISWDSRSQLSWNLPLPTTQSNNCLFKKKGRKTPKEKTHLHQRNQVFPISIMETLLNLVLLASLWRV